MPVIWSLPYGLAGLYDFIRGEYQSSWSPLSTILPNWSYYLWVGVGIILFMVVTFEGAYRIVQRKTKEMDAKIEKTIAEQDAHIKKQDSILLNNLSYIGEFIKEGKRHSVKLKSPALTNREVEMLLEWSNDISNFLQDKLPDEYPLWYDSIGNISKISTPQDLIVACEKGRDCLKCILNDLKSQDKK